MIILIAQPHQNEPLGVYFWYYTNENIRNQINECVQT